MPMRISGGNPAGYPDFKPLNPWGREMPKPRPNPPRLYQIWVMWDGEPTPIGPRAPRDILGPMFEEINKAIVAGREKTWADPQLLPV